MLSIASIELHDFRNYREFSLGLSDEVTIIVGKNGLGKTNIIEALELLTLLDSFRNPAWDEVVRWNKNCARATLRLSGDGRNLDCSLLIEEGRRQYRLNDKRKNTAELRGLMPSVLFTPDNLQLVKGSAEQRRDAIDLVGVQLSRTYARIRSDYQKIIRNKNRIFKEDTIDREVLMSWNDNLVEVASMFLAHRIQLFAAMETEVSRIYGALVPDEQLDAAYYPSWVKEKDDFNREHAEQIISSDREAIRNRLSVEIAARMEDEIIRRRCIVGPHRDEVVFYLNGRDARRYGSQGQMRTIALAWKIAEVEVITKIHSQRPVLLLDDVMSELDEHRRGALIEYLAGKVQTVITTTNLQYFDPDFIESAYIVDLAEMLERTATP